MTPHGCISASPVISGRLLLQGASRTPAITAYAARAIGAKLSFAYSLVTDKVVNPQFSTSLINTCRSCFAPTEIHLNVLVVEALGTAPKSCTTFSPYHQTVLYLYHIKGLLSIPFFKKIKYRFLLLLEQPLHHNQMLLNIHTHQEYFLQQKQSP